MPIKGLTDRGPSFPRIGELRKGGEKVSANKPGPDLDYFRFTSKDPDVTSAFGEAYGPKPRSVNCYLPFATAWENFDAWIEEWAAGGLKWRGDGENLVVWQKPDGTYSQEPRPQPATGGKQVGRLKIIIPELQRLAYVTALTTSLNDIMDMPSILEAYQALRGDLRGIPFVLSRVQRMVSTPGPNGTRVRREKWLWHLEAQPVWVQAQLSVMQRDALPGGRIVEGQYQLGAGIDMETGELFDEEDEAPAVVANEPVVVNRPTRKAAPPPPADNGPMPDDEQVIFETDAAGFFDAATALIDRYDNVHALKNAAKKLGFTGVPKEASKRVEMYRAIRDHAAARDAEEAGAYTEDQHDHEDGHPLDFGDS